VKRLCEEINRLVPEARAMVAGEHLGNSQAYRFIRAMSWGTSLLAVIVGVLGVMNTMLMTVFERTQEICILLAIGWKRGRIMSMVLSESALLGLLGGVLGVLIGTLGVKVIETLPAIHDLLEPDLSVRLMVNSVAIAVVVGVISGLYPAWRGSRLTPSLALQG
jgi:putative ABC transport system permease protein